MAKSVARIFGGGKKKAAPTPAPAAPVEPEPTAQETADASDMGQESKKKGRLALFATAGQQQGLLNPASTGRKRFLGS